MTQAPSSDFILRHMQHDYFTGEQTLQKRHDHHACRLNEDLKFIFAGSQNSPKGTPDFLIRSDMGHLRSIILFCWVTKIPI